MCFFFLKIRTLTADLLLGRSAVSLSKGDDALTITSGGGVYLLPNDGKMRCASWN